MQRRGARSAARKRLAWTLFFVPILQPTAFAEHNVLNLLAPLPPRSFLWQTRSGVGLRTSILAACPSATEDLPAIPLMALFQASGSGPLRILTALDSIAPRCRKKNLAIMACS